MLSSNRAGGTTGAVVWKVTPLFATWLSSPSPSNLLFRTGVLSAGTSTVLELGCGVSGLVGIATGPLVKRYVLTDQSYVSRLVEANIAQNTTNTSSHVPRGKAGGSVRKGGKSSSSSSSSTKPTPTSGAAGSNVEFHTLDWETDTPHASLCTPDVVIACDCIYNEALIPPLVQTTAEACRLKTTARLSEEEEEVEGGEGLQTTPCVAVVAQQLRDPEIFEAWLREFMAKGFRVWKIPDAELPDGLKESSGFVVHVGVLREALERRRP